MDKVDKESLLKEIEYYSRLIEQHEALEREKELKSANTQNLNLVQSSFQRENVKKNKIHPVSSFYPKHSFKNICNPNAINSKRTVCYGNQNLKIKHEFKIDSSKWECADNKASSINFLNNNAVTKCKDADIISKSNSCKNTSLLSNKSEKLDTKNFIKELESLTVLLKKKTSGNQSKLLNSTVQNRNVVHNKLPEQKKVEPSAFNILIPLSNEKVLSKKVSTKMSPRTFSANSRNCYSKINSNNKNCFQKTNFSLHCKSKDLIGNLKISNPDNTTTSLNLVKNATEPKNKLQKVATASHSRKVIFSASKNASDILCSSINAPVLVSKSAFSSKQELTKGLNRTVKLGFSNKVKSPNSRYALALLKGKSPDIAKTSKLMKLKSGGTRYSKVNEHLISPSETLRKRYSVIHRTPLSKRTKRKINTKYKVVNKTVTPVSIKRKGNSFCKFVRRSSSSLSIDTDALFKDLNDSAVDKLEKNLLAVSAELTSTTMSEKDDVNSKKKMSKTNHSKYKIINSNVTQKYFMKKRQNITNLKSDVKKIRHSKFSIVNKSVKLVHVVTPVKHEKQVLVKRLFKSKNAIINKNASPVNYSAKLIKSKYLTLNKRKSSYWQKHYQFAKVPVHQKHKGFFSSAKVYRMPSKYQRTAISIYHPRVSKRFKSYGSCKISGGVKYKKRMINKYAHNPVVYIHGLRYSSNFSGKTLKKLPAKGQTRKTLRRNSSKILMRSPENAVRTLTPSNMANRVLHRSIHRVLSASSKKSLSKVNTYCMFYNRFGRCNRGVKCTYIHDPSKIAVCTRYLRGTCKIEGCPFSHEVDPGKMAICSFFLVGECNKKNCPYRHEKLSSNAVLCKDFVQGYCHYGKTCKKAHILICPKYMQGECDKGSSCAFPHPPQKAKKQSQNEAKDEEPKPDDVLLEKVFRYFQQCGDNVASQTESDGKRNTNLVVPKKLQIEEQPSFIPLSDSADL